MSEPTAPPAESATVSTEAPFLLALFTETPLHTGTGQSTGIIDLPVQRERHTQFPIIPATSLKGSLREQAERRWSQQRSRVNVLFGPEVRRDQGDDLHAGAVAFSDARLLAFPVRSLIGVFCWVTCPLALARLSRDLRLADEASPGPEHYGPGEQRMQTTYQQGMVVLEDLAFQASADSAWSVTVDRLARFLPEGQAHNVYREKFRRDLVLIEDGDFCYLVQHATQVTARVKLNDHKTTTEDGGNLWYEETVPADTLFYALVRPERPRTTNSDLNGAAGVRAAILELLDGTLPFLQVGGNETVGHGWCAMRVVTGWEAETNG